MVGRALSERVKKQAARRRLNAQYQKAVDEYLAEQQKPKDKRRGLRPIAEKHGVNPRTLCDLANGKTSMSAFNASKQKLTPAEERVLVDFVIASADRGFPLTNKSISQHANSIILNREKPGEPVGGSWVTRFVGRHCDELAGHWTSPLANERARALNPDAVKAWFDLVEEMVVKKGVRRENMYGMDESGFPPSDQGTVYVIGRKGGKRQHKVGNANRENVTALVTICADGTVLRLTIIFKAKQFLKKWGTDNVAEASLGISENGWTDGEMAMEWMRKDFDPLTRDKANGETRVLFMDGHSSHYTADLLEFCLENKIEILAYPPHCTHALQGLDVVCFARMKDIWKEEINQHEQETGRGVNKEDFCRVFGRAFLRAFTPSIIKAAFEKTGLYPFNRNVISEEQMRPSEETSTVSTFPLPQPSPVRAVLTAFHNHEFTRAGTRPDTPPAQDPPESTHTQPPNSIPGPSTPKRPRNDPASDPDLMTPSKRMRFLGVGLASTTSGSFLVTKVKATHLELSTATFKPVIERLPKDLPMPNWSLLNPASIASSRETVLSRDLRLSALEESLAHARDQLAASQAIIETQNAQLVVQNLTMGKANQVIHEKEKNQGKKSDRTVLFPNGRGRHLTNSEVIQEKRQLEINREKKEAEKEARKSASEKRKLEKDELERKWKEMLAEHACKVEDWEAECQRLRNEGVMVKNLPKKPKRPIKPKLKEADVEDEDAESSDEDGE